MIQKTMLSVYDGARRVATIKMSRNELATEKAGAPGEVHCFWLANGDLIRPWDQQTVLQVTDGIYFLASARIAALPLETEGSGLLQFV